MAQNPPLHPAYRPDIDGLRAVAVLLVVIYHAFPNRIPGGYVGVDIFFVISGFLISTIILGNLEKEKFSYRDFYARRIKRIFPALAIVLSTVLILGWYVSLTGEFEQLGKHVAAGAAFIANLALWSEAGYFDTAAEMKPLLHLWSLGVEEQFYLVWPLLLGFVWRKRLNSLAVMATIFLLSFVVNIYLIRTDPVACFFSPFSRFWELMVGCMLAYVSLYRPQLLPKNTTVLTLMSLAGLALITTSAFVLTPFSSFPGWWAVLPVLGSFLIIAGRPTNWVNRFVLGNRPAVWIGLVSYPLYLWHWPLLTFARIVEVDNTPTRGTRVLMVVLSILLAGATYEFVEKRFKKGYTRRAIGVLSASMAALFAVGLAANAGALKPRLHSDAMTQSLAAIGDFDARANLVPLRGHKNLLVSRQGSPSKTVFLGDSHIQHYVPKISTFMDENPSSRTTVVGASGGCIPIPNVFEDQHMPCREITGSTIEFLNRSDVDTVVVGGSWNGYFIDQIQTASDGQVKKYSFYYVDENGDKHRFRDGDGAALALQELERFLIELSTTKRVFLLLDNPSGKEFAPTATVGSRLSRVEQQQAPAGDLRVDFPAEQRALRERLIELAERADVTVIDPAPTLCEDQKCRVTMQDGRPIYSDDGHLRPFFVEQEADFLDIALQ